MKYLGRVRTGFWLRKASSCSGRRSPDAIGSAPVNGACRLSVGAHDPIRTISEDQPTKGDLEDIVIARYIVDQRVSSHSDVHWSHRRSTSASSQCDRPVMSVEDRSTVYCQRSNRDWQRSVALACHLRKVGSKDSQYERAWRRADKARINAAANEGQLAPPITRHRFFVTMGRQSANGPPICAPRMTARAPSIPLAIECRCMLTTHPFDDDKLREECGDFRRLWRGARLRHGRAGSSCPPASRAGSRGHHQLGRRRISTPIGRWAMSPAISTMRTIIRQLAGRRRLRPCPLFDDRRDGAAQCPAALCGTGVGRLRRLPTTAISPTR